MSLRAALLGLLSEGPATGYALIKDFDVSTSVIWPAPKGEIYRELARLEADGCVARGSAEGARGQREWRITAKGRSELKRGLLAAADYTLRYDPILRAAFLAALTPAEVRKVVAADRAFFESELKVLKTRRAGPMDDKRDRRRYALPMAIAFYEAMLKWCDEAEAIAKKG
ncbi:MAG TPA: PadR family transcriptional regulator [Rhizomicrobium sp.]|nr:PadR family transcriptional regulator [Rhizomicrobium sp.]